MNRDPVILHTRDYLAPIGHRTEEIRLNASPVQRTEPGEGDNEMSDPVVAKSNGDSGQFEPHPEGQFVAVCVDVIDLGERVLEFEGHKKIKPSVVLVFATGERRKDGKLAVVTPEFNVSMDSRATLRKFLEGWRGKSYTEEEAQRGVPLHKLEGAPCLMTIEQRTSRTGRVYATPHIPTPLPKAMKEQIPDVIKEYARSSHWEDRKKRYAAEVEAERALESESAAVLAMAGGNGGSRFAKAAAAVEAPADEIPF